MLSSHSGLHSPKGTCGLLLIPRPSPQRELRLALSVANTQRTLGMPHALRTQPPVLFAGCDESQARLRASEGICKRTPPLVNEPNCFHSALAGARPYPAPSSPHIVGVPPRELADVLIDVLEALFGFLELLLQSTHSHRHPRRRNHHSAAYQQKARPEEPWKEGVGESAHPHVTCLRQEIRQSSLKVWSDSYTTQ